MIRNLSGLSLNFEMNNFREVYNCALCFHEFSTEGELVRHIKSCMKPFCCETCDKVLSSKRTYKAHLSRHSKLTRFWCPKCSKSFGTQYILKAHLKLHDPARESFFCDLCGTKFSTSYKLKYHFTKGCTKAKNKECPICHVKDTQTNILSHFESTHNINIEAENLKFSNIQEFEAWKEKIERETCSRFVVKNKERKRSYAHYHCHRNGHFKRKGSRRRVKSCGTNKINGFCPAKIWINIGDEIEVCYVKTHVGHNHEPERLVLSKNDRDNIAAKIEAKVSFEEILNDYEELSDKRIPKKKDLYNIVARNGIKLDPKNNKTINTTTLENEKILRLCHKSDDVAVVVMSDSQMEKLKLFGNNLICVTCIHNMNFLNEDYFIISVLVLNGEMVHPCTFMLCNRISTEVIEMLFGVVKSAVSGCRILMTDVSECYYEGWVRVMAAPEKRLFTPWDVKKMEKTSEVDKALNEMTQDEDCLAVVIAKMAEDRQSEHDLTRFGSHFTSILAKDAVKRNLGSNMDVILEKACLSLQKKYGVAKSLNKAVLNLTRLTKQKKPIREKRKIKEKIKERHQASKELAGYQVLHDNNNWLVPTSKENNNMYYIVSPSNLACRCDLKCEECKLCLHSYVCSCPDSSFDLNMCSHIHLVKTIMPEKMSTLVNDYSIVCDNVDLEKDISVESVQNLDVNGSLEKCVSSSFLEKEKESLIRELSSMISSVSSIKELEAAKRHLDLNILSSILNSHQENPTT